MIDFHTHILPEIDDGSVSVEMSLELLKTLKNQGVNKVLLSPHFYAYAFSVESFDEEKSFSIQKLLAALKNDPVDVELYVGCEVLYFEELWRVEKLKDFCVKGTEYLLVEMPLSQWSDNMVRCMEKIVGKGFTPVIAHFERYLKYKGNVEKIYELMEIGALLQMNCNYINDFLTRRKAVKFVKSGNVFVLGTDCHNMTDRAPNYEKAVNILKRKMSERRFRQFFSRQKLLLRDATRIYP